MHERQAYIPEYEHSTYHWSDRPPEDKLSWLAKAHTTLEGRDVSELIIGHLTAHQNPTEADVAWAQRTYDAMDRRLTEMLDRYELATELHVDFMNPDRVSTTDPNTHGYYETHLATLLFLTGHAKQDYERLLDPRAIIAGGVNRLRPSGFQMLANLTKKGLRLYEGPGSDGTYHPLGGIAPRIVNAPAPDGLSVGARREKNFSVYELYAENAPPMR